MQKQNPDYSQVAPGSGSDSGDTQTQTQTQSAGQPSMMNPVLFSPSMSMATPQHQQHLLAFPGPVQHPPMHAMPGLTDQDFIRIAQLVKTMLHDEINQIVDLKVSSATAALQTELDDVKARCARLADEVTLLKSKHDDIEQYSRRMCLRISGIDESENEDVNKLVLEFAARVGANIGPGDIDRAHRIGKIRNNDTNSGARSPRKHEIIIKFTNSSARLSLLRGRAKLREQNVRNIFINEDLTPTRNELAFECRRIMRIRTSKIKKTWVYAGYPHILDDSGRKLRITCLADLDNYQVTDTAQPMNT
ncbi:MAG: hypothetical protein AB2693_15750 [Candidatus Thiodiazotropha sp.]